jgi:hypothetical protein
MANNALQPISEKKELIIKDEYLKPLKVVYPYILPPIKEEEPSKQIFSPKISIKRKQIKPPFDLPKLK